MLPFKIWLSLTEKNSEYDKIFDQRDKTKNSNVGKLLGFNTKLNIYSYGSFAVLYDHPTQKDKLIKVTSHESDIKNIVKSQGLNSPNIVKAFPWIDGKMIKQLPTLNSLAIIIEKIIGSSMSYRSSEFYDLSLYGKFDLAAYLIDGNLPEYLQKKYGKEIKIQNQTLIYHDKNNPKEYAKLTDLFNTLSTISSSYRINLSDFEDNIMDTGDRYVIIDMGF